MKLRREWEIQPRDIHLNPLSPDISFIVQDGWQPFGVTGVPNSADQNQIRLWLRRRPPLFWHRKPYEIRIQNAGWGGHQVLLHLTAGWEPFGVSDSAGNHLIWFRRQA